MAKFPERLRLLRNSKGLSQADFAKQIKISKSSVNMYERGEREPNIATLESIADYFNVDMDYLLGKSDVANKLEFDVSSHVTTSEHLEEKRSIKKEDIMLALARGKEDVITDAMFEEIQNFADYIIQREAAKKEEKA